MTRVTRSGSRGYVTYVLTATYTRDRMRMPQLLETESILSDIKLPYPYCHTPHLPLHITLP